MELKISALARDEIESSKKYYELQQEKLGDRFESNILKSVKSILDFPYLYPNVSERVKKLVLHKFPYSIFYSVNDKYILILSVAHHHRKPKY